MLAEESLKHIEDRKEVFNEKNNFGLSENIITKKKLPNKSHSSPTMNLGERAKDNR